MAKEDHVKLVLPGPVEVRREILDAQGAWMIGHRQPVFVDLFARLQEKLRKAFITESRVYVSGSSGTGLWEGAIRCGVRDDQKVLHLVSGAFSERWAYVSKVNGKQVDVLEIDWGKAFRPEQVDEALKNGPYDALCVVHNETSTGVTNPIAAIAEVIRKYEDTLFFVDTVSGFLGTELRVADWGIDVALTSSQKAFALPPGISFAAVSDRVLARAEQIGNRGYYFDFIELEKSLVKNNTPSTPPIPLMWAADVQLTDIMEEGLENRWARHLAMRDRTIEWASAHGFELFSEDGYRSATISTVANNLSIDVAAMAKFMENEKGYAIDKGYGKLKGETFRVAHMGDMTMETLEDILAGFDEYLGAQ